jgi:hypothetical protein
LLFCVWKDCRVAASPYPTYGIVGPVSAAPPGETNLLTELDRHPRAPLQFGTRALVYQLRPLRG